MEPTELMGLAAELYPIHRSQTGDGVRDTLARIGSYIPIDVHEVPTGTEVFDWVIPKEWNIASARITGPDGRIVADSDELNLHVVSNSVPVDITMSLEELRPHLHSVPEMPDAIPYRSSFFEETWGFCLADRTLQSLEEGDYHVRIDASLDTGSLTYGECFVPGASNSEILLSTHTCHPSLGNDNVSGLVVATAVGAAIASRPDRRVGVRILFAPGTIGSITWMAHNQDRMDDIVAGMTLNCLGDRAPIQYKKTVFGDRLTDKVAELIVGTRGGDLIDFYPFGYDERQYNAPGFRLPMGSLMRSQHGAYAEYHTSADDLSYIDGDQLAASVETVLEFVDTIESNATFINLQPHGEPQLGRRGLYGSVGRAPVPEQATYTLFWVLNLSDGDHDLIDIALRSGMDLPIIVHAASELEAVGLLEKA